MSPEHQIPPLTRSRILALRGKLSASTLARHTGPIPDIPLGDPGFLLPTILGVARSAPAFELGVVPHYVDKFHPTVTAFRTNSSITVLDIQTNPKSFLQQLAHCRCVISSSLHGLIFAEALGIPNAWVVFSDQIAGNGFKFRDWFSVCGDCPSQPIRVRQPLPIKTLAGACELHQPNIATEALQNALRQLPQNIQQRPTHFIRPARPASKLTPIFIISYNRGRYLKKIISSYLRFNRPVDIVIHDNGSDDPETLIILKNLQTKGIEVFYHKPISHPDELNAVDETVQEYFKRWAEPVPYVVTDSDIDMRLARADSLDVYDAFLNRFRDIECVGPMLKIRDIPRDYPLFNQVMNRHIEQFWQQEPTWHDFPFGSIAAIRAPIDTTFALHRAGESFRRLKNGMRLYSPHEARHLDWYICGEEHQPYSQSASKQISHWNSREQFSLHCNTPLQYSSFLDVASHQAGSRRTEIVHINADNILQQRQE
ncbi:hypothetical protein CCR91_21155 [Thiorhodovibrio winogradskyi]|nr:polysaccharide pyruvyl transferase family protein [Thiorhodovibrio winogradskyi]MBK5971202.1 hypothetical protein [Thiorhodovibrio winogradskyi]